jgi:alpha-tubulin suppressor-like RCC1 family protein
VDTSGSPHVETELLPKLVEALRGVRVGSIAAAGTRSYALLDTGELWTWGWQHDDSAPLGPVERIDRCHGFEDHSLPKPMEALQGIKVDAVAASPEHTLALADDGSGYAWGHGGSVRAGALGVSLRMLH